jgi:hypothetical protein
MDQFSESTPSVREPKEHRRPISKFSKKHKLSHHPRPVQKNHSTLSDKINGSRTSRAIDSNSPLKFIKSEIVGPGNVTSRFSVTNSKADQLLKSKVKSLGFLSRLKNLKKSEKDIDDESRAEDFLDWKCEPYTEGSDLADKDTKFLKLSEQEKEQRVKQLWAKCIRTSRSGAIIVDSFRFLNGKLLGVPTYSPTSVSKFSSLLLIG